MSKSKSSILHTPKSTSSTPALPAEWKNWEGTFDELILESGKVLAQVAPGTSQPSGSLVRYYQQKGVVGRGRTQGRTKRFGAEELAQVVGAKWLAEQSIPLSLAKTAVTSSPENPQPHPAQTLVAQLMQSAGLGGPAPSAHATVGRDALLRSALGSRALGAGLPTHSVSAAFPGSTPRAMANAFVPQASGLDSSTPEYVSLPAGGTVRYALDAGTTVELATDGDIKAQAQALRTLADQLLANLNKNSPTS